MKCPNDQMEMEKGILAGEARSWMKEPQGIMKIAQTVVNVATVTVYAYKCPKCGKVELYAEK